MEISIVNLSNLEGERRIDAEYYHSEILNLKEIVMKSAFEVIELGKLVKNGKRAVYWNTEIIPKNEMTEDDVFFLQASNIDSQFPYIFENDMGAVWRKDWEDYTDGRVEHGELLIEVKGKAEKVALVTNEFPTNTLISGSLFKLTIKDLEPEYLLVYLLSKFGKGFRERLKSNLLVSFVNRQDLYSIPIVILPNSKRNEIKEGYLEAYVLYKKAEECYEKANDLLLNELNLNENSLEYDLFYNSNLKELINSNRIDAEYYQPLYGKIIEKLKSNFEVKPLKNFLVELKKGIEVGGNNYSEEGIPFIRVSNISINGLVEKDQKYLNEELYDNLKEEFEPKMGEILLSKDASPGIAYVVNNPLKGIISSGILRLVVDETLIDKEYLALYINSILGKLQIERDCAGSIIKHWRSEQVEEFLIPILSKNAQLNITSLLIEFKDYRLKAINKLEEVKNHLETLIESSNIATNHKNV